MKLKYLRGKPRLFHNNVKHWILSIQQAVKEYRPIYQAALEATKESLSIFQKFFFQIKLRASESALKGFAFNGGVKKKKKEERTKGKSSGAFLRLLQHHHPYARIPFDCYANWRVNAPSAYRSILARFYMLCWTRYYIFARSSDIYWPFFDVRNESSLGTYWIS